LATPPASALPNTGGPAHGLFTILGSILILGAGVLLWRRRTEQFNNGFLREWPVHFGELVFFTSFPLDKMRIYAYNVYVS
jgi:Gram positive anchor.